MRPTLGLLFLLLLVLTVEAAEEPKDYLWKGLAKLVVETLKLVDGSETKVSRQRSSHLAPRQSLLDTELRARDCGKVLVKLTNRISGGYTARMGEFPSFVRLNIVNMRDNGTYYGTQCGGTLLSDLYILTVAHCLKRLNSTVVEVVASTTVWAKGTPPGDSPLIKYKAAKWCPSDKFEHTNPFNRLKHHDVALIRLERPVAFGDYVQPACLPKAPSRGKRGLKSVGLGAILFVEWQGQVITQPKFHERLQVLPVDVADKCDDPRDEHPSKVCMDNNDEKYKGNQCIGDSGSGVYGLDPSGRQEVVAAISYGYEACVKGIRGQPIDTDIYNVRPELELLMARCRV